jgi:hypothetical protein
MDRDKFFDLFLSALNLAIENVKKCCGQDANNTIIIELHGCGLSGSLMSPKQAFEYIYISEGAYYAIIDVLVRSTQNDQTIIFLRISDHDPVDYEQTWSPNDHGPFKQLDADCSSLRPT